MKLNNFFLIALLFVFSNQCFALAIDEWEYKTYKGNMKATPGCKTKEKAKKQASSGYRFDRFSKLLCTQIAYGWSLEEVEHKGELTCDVCDDWEDDEAEEDAKAYSCYMKDVIVKCRTVIKGWQLIEMLLLEVGLG